MISSFFKFFRGLINKKQSITFSMSHTDEECYLEGWTGAQQGFPLNENPWEYGSRRYNMWYCGWNDFVDNH